jgi:hypothetical protein
MTGQPIEILDSWNVTGQGIIVELKHQEKGLPQGARLISRQTGRQWTVKSRLFFNHTLDRQRKFSNESESFMHLAFNPIDNLEKSKTNILNKEEQGIYQYALGPIEHEDKPIVGDLLDVE